MLIFTLAALAAAAPAPDVEAACAWAEQGRAARAIPKLEESLRDTSLPKPEARRAWACLALANADLADDPEQADAGSRLDRAAFAFSMCLDSSTSSPPVAPPECVAIGPRLQAVTLQRAEWLRVGIAASNPAFLPAEAVARCEQAAQYLPASLLDEVCQVRLAATLGDPLLAIRAAERAIDAPAGEGETNARDSAIAAGMDLPLRFTGDDQAARALADRAVGKLGAGLPGLPEAQKALANLDTFQQRLVPLRTSAQAGDAKAHKAWLLALDKARLADLAAREAARSELAFPEDAALAEVIGVVRVNAVANGALQKAELLRLARASFTRCLTLDPAHPRCAASLSKIPEIP